MEDAKNLARPPEMDRASSPAHRAATELTPALRSAAAPTQSTLSQLNKLPLKERASFRRRLFNSLLILSLVALGAFTIGGSAAWALLSGKLDLQSAMIKETLHHLKDVLHLGGVK